MATGQLDQILNVAIPILLILVIIGFIWVKFGEPYIYPMIKRAFERANRPREESTGGLPQKDISYEW